MDTTEVLMDLRERMVRIETKIDATVDHEKRISALETSYKIGVAVLSMAIFIVTFFQDWITSRFA